jgi:hypothetical protein
MSLWKNRPKCSPSHFRQIYFRNLDRGEGCQKRWSTSVIFRNKCSK